MLCCPPGRLGYERPQCLALPLQTAFARSFSKLFGFVLPGLATSPLKLKHILALFRKSYSAVTPFRRGLQPLQLGSRVIEVPVDHGFTSEQCVEILFLRQEEMIRHRIHFRITRLCERRFCWIACSWVSDLKTVRGMSLRNLTAFTTDEPTKSPGAHGNLLPPEFFEETNRLIVFTKFSSQSGDDSEENLISLCEGCHSIVHRLNPRSPRLGATKRQCNNLRGVSSASG